MIVGKALDLEEVSAQLSNVRDMMSVVIGLFGTSDVTDYGKQYGAILVAAISGVDAATEKVDALSADLRAIGMTIREKERSNDANI